MPAGADYYHCAMPRPAPAIVLSSAQWLPKTPIAPAATADGDREASAEWDQAVNSGTSPGCGLFERADARVAALHASLAACLALPNSALGTLKTLKSRMERTRENWFLR